MEALAFAEGRSVRPGSSERWGCAIRARRGEAGIAAAASALDAGQRRGVLALKTNAVRLLERLGVVFQLRPYEVDPDDLSAESVAHKTGLPPEQVFKTLVVRGDRNGVLLAVVPGDRQLDLKALARASGDKRVDTVPLKEVEPLTGYVRGGVTALACKKPYPVFVDETAQLFDLIAISAGVRGLQILLAPDAYLKAVRATVAAISI
jgi:Cys-tRNA(Pro)/Cys-tRNA(Cys) deacylase